MSKLTIGKMANLYGLARTTLYDRIKAGTISYEINNSGQKVIDLSEMLRIYGEPDHYKKENNQEAISLNTKNEKSTVDTNINSNAEIISIYKEQIEMLKHQQSIFEQREQQAIAREMQALEREKSYLEMFNELKDEIKTLKLVLDYKDSQNKNNVSPTEKDSVSLTSIHTESDSQNSNVSHHISEIKTQPKERGFLSKIFFPNKQ